MIRNPNRQGATRYYGDRGEDRSSEPAVPPWKECHCTCGCRAATDGWQSLRSRVVCVLCFLSSDSHTKVDVLG